MSSDQSLDPQLIEQTKHQIRALVNEIAQLSKSELSPQEFYSEFLPRVVSALAAIGGAVWTIEDEGRLTLQYQINLQETKLRDKEEEQVRHGRLLHKMISGGEGALVPPHSGTDEDDQAGNPTDFLLVMGPLRTDVETVGVVEIFQRPESGPTTQQGYLRFLLQMCDLAGDFIKSRQLRHFSDRQVLWTQLEEFARAVHSSLEPRETAYTISNEGRRLIECDRVSVAIRKGNKCLIESVSGQDLFDKRSNTVRLLGKLATAVVATGEPIWYTGDTSDMAPQVEDAVQEYVDEAHSKTVAVLPLQRPQVDVEEEPDKREEPEPPVGALIVEQIEDSKVPEKMLQRVAVVCQHSSTALANSLEHQNLFLMPVWRALGKTRWILRARTLPKTLAIVGAVLALFLSLAIVPYSFELESKGTLEPRLRCDVFAGIDGVVEQIHGEHGQMVQGDNKETGEKGTLLVELRNTDLDVAITDVMGKRTTTRQQILSIQRALMEQRRLTVEEQNRLSGRLLELKQEEQSLNAQWALYLKKQEELKVTSPANGEIVTWDVYDRLIHRPVQRGQVLMRVADPKGPWQLELHMGENRMGHIVSAEKKLRKEVRKRIRDTLRKLPPKELGAVSPKQLDKMSDEELDALVGVVTRKKLSAMPEDRLDKLLGQVARKYLDELTDDELAEVLGPVTREQLAKMSERELDKLLRQTSREELGKLSDEELGRVSRRRLGELWDEDLDDRLEVTFILATEPGQEYTGRVKEIHYSAEVRGDEGNTVLIKVDFDKRKLPHLRPGATVTGKIYCGRRSVGYVLFHDLIAFIQSRILFRF